MTEMEQAMRPIAGDALIAMLELAVGQRLDVTFGRHIAHNVKAAPGEQH